MFAYSRPPKDLRFYPTIERLTMFLSVIRKQLGNKKWNTTFFDRPGTISGKNQEVIDELNKKLEKNHDYKLPKGYYKKLEKNIDYVYRLPRNLPISENYRVVYETVDQIFADKLGIHILEPLSMLFLKAKALPQKKKKIKS